MHMSFSALCLAAEVLMAAPPEPEFLMDEVLQRLKPSCQIALNRSAESAAPPKSMAAGFLPLQKQIQKLR
jgi:hypothetical protein